MKVRENLIRLCEKINDGHYKITPDCAEYKVFEQWITDEQIAVMLALTSMKPGFVPMIARKAGMSVKRTREVLHEITDIGLCVQVIVPKVGLEIYLLPPYTPGIFEFLLINEKFCIAHPEIAYASGSIRPGSLVDRCMKFINRRLYRSADRVVALTDEMRAFLCSARAGLTAERVAVIPNWAHEKTTLPDAQTRKTFGFASDQFVIAYLCKPFWTRRSP